MPMDPYGDPAPMPTRPNDRQHRHNQRLEDRRARKAERQRARREIALSLLEPLEAEPQLG